MKRLVAVLLMTAWASGGLAQDAQVKPVLPQDFKWFTPPTNATIHGAWVIGSEQAADPYLFRVRLDAGGRMAPHTHPDTRNTTVLSGTLYVGFLKRQPAADAVRTLTSCSNDVDRFRVKGREVYWLGKAGFSGSTFSGAKLEKIVGPVTMRNVTTVRKLAGM